MNTYEVEINGVKTTLKLSDADAEARGLKPVTNKAKAPANKSKTPANKARTTADKRAEAVSKGFVAKDNA